MADPCILSSHLDPRYAIGSEAHCPGYLCCRTGPGHNSTMDPSFITQPAPRFGAYNCDSPYDLAVAALESIPVLTGTMDTGFNFTIFTGDLTSHDEDNALSRSYVEYIETTVFTLCKKFLGAGPLVSCLAPWPRVQSLTAILPVHGPRKPRLVSFCFFATHN